VSIRGTVRRRGAPWWLGLAAVASVFATSCATPVGVRRIGPQEANRMLTATVLTSGEPSALAREYLYRLSLADRYREDPAGTIATLHEGLGQADESRRLFALAELSFDHAERSGDRSYYLGAAVYAWAFLFPQDTSERPGPYDPRARTAMDLYNRGLTEGLAVPALDEVDLAARTVELPFGTLTLDVDPAGFEYGGHRLVKFASLADYEVRGLRNRYRRRGIGAPLAATVERHGDSAERWIAPRAKVPVTALLRFADVRGDMSRGAMRGTLELYDADAHPSIDIGDLTLALEAETTTTLAYQLEGSPIWDFEIAGFRRGDFQLFDDDTDLVMLHPYQPGRIPVVFVHGTASSPARWVEMVNELKNDPYVGHRYQFWYFIYNTGNPVSYSAMHLRESLQQVIQELDPMGADESLSRMVVIGHSQGGLLTKMTVVNSGSRFWDSEWAVPFDEAELHPETRDLLRRSMFIEPLPFVSRVIFICTPHRGSYLAENFLGKVARRLVKLPAGLTKAGVELMKLNAVSAAKTAWRLPTAIDNMDWSNPFLRTLDSLPIAPGVHAHSIVAVRGDGPPDLGDDGVVRYASAHLDGVASEFVVRSGHSTQSRPETIEEVRRILYAHVDGL